MKEAGGLQAHGLEGSEALGSESEENRAGEPWSLGASPPFPSQLFFL